MAKPRKEQVRNLKAEYRFHHFGELATSFGNFPSQQFEEPIYSIFIDSYTQTKKLGGAAESCPAFLRGVSGPWVVPSGSTFTVQMSGVNNELPVQVTIQASDFVRSGNVQLLSAGRLADRINTTLGMSSITSESQKFAYVDNGQICMRSRTLTEISLGSDAYITLAGVTSGILSILGFTSDTAITAFGVDGPTRGVVTESADGLGGYIQLNGGVDHSAPLPISDSLHRSISPWSVIGSVPTGWKTGYELDNDPRSPIHGRIRRSRTVAGNSFQIQYFQNTQNYPNVEFKTISPNLIDSSDSLTVELYHSNSPVVVSSANIVFTTSPNRTFADLVEEINASWGVGGTYWENLRQARVVFPVEARFIFPYNATLTIKFNEQPTNVSMTFPAGSSYTSTELAAFINARIASVGQSAQGTCIAGGSSGAHTVELRSLLSTGPTSSIRITTDSGIISEVLGLTPGLYRGSNLATLVGGDSIRFQSPIRGGSMKIMATGVNTAARGFNLNGQSSFTVVSEISTIPATPPLSNLSIPEMMEFWEVPDGIASEDATFDSQSTDRTITPESGWKAAAASSLVSSSGRIPAGILPTSYNVLRAQLIQVQVSPAGGYTSPKIQGFTGNSTGPNNILELRPSEALSATQIPIRMFATGNSIIYTVNAQRDSEGAAWWSKDSQGLNSYFFEFKDGVISMGSYGPTNLTWNNTMWSRSFATDDPIQSASTITIGGRGNSLPPDVARISVPRRNTTTGASPSGNNKFTLVMESPANGANALLPLRMYMTTSLNPLTNEANGFMFTVNARWDQGAGLWVRDVVSQVATAWMQGSQYTSGTQTSGTYMFSMDVNTWTTWTKIGEFSNTWNSSTTTHAGTVRYGSNALDVLTPTNTIKAWGIFNCNNPTPNRVRDYNISTLTRFGTGQYNWTYSNNVPANNAVQVTSSSALPPGGVFLLSAYSTATLGYVNIASTPGDGLDNMQISMLLVGSA